MLPIYKQHRHNLNSSVWPLHLKQHKFSCLWFTKLLAIERETWKLTSILYKCVQFFSSRPSNCNYIHLARKNVNPSQIEAQSRHCWILYGSGRGFANGTFCKIYSRKERAKVMHAKSANMSKLSLTEAPNTTNRVCSPVLWVIAVELSSLPAE